MILTLVIIPNKYLLWIKSRKIQSLCFNVSLWSKCWMQNVMEIEYWNHLHLHWLPVNFPITIQFFVYISILEWIIWINPVFVLRCYLWLRKTDKIQLPSLTFYVHFMQQCIIRMHTCNLWPLSVLSYRIGGPLCTSQHVNTPLNRVRTKLALQSSMSKLWREKSLTLRNESKLDTNVRNQCCCSLSLMCFHRTLVNQE